MWSDVERGGNKKKNLFEGNFWNLFPVAKKMAIIDLYNSLKIIDWFLSYLYFKTKSFSIKALNIGRELDVHTGHEGSVLQYFTRSKLEKREIFVKGGNLPVPVRRFWTGSTTAAVVQKITENASFFWEKSVLEWQYIWSIFWFWVAWYKKLTWAKVQTKVQSWDRIQVIYLLQNCPEIWSSKTSTLLKVFCRNFYHISFTIIPL